VGANHEVNSPKIFLDDDGAGKTKCFQKVATEFLKKII